MPKSEIMVLEMLFDNLATGMVEAFNDIFKIFRVYITICSDSTEINSYFQQLFRSNR